MNAPYTKWPPNPQIIGAFRLDVVILPSGYLGLQAKIEGNSYNLARLYSVGANNFAVDTGMAMADRLSFTVNGSGQADSFTYSEYKSTGTDGKPVYQEQKFTR